VLCDPLHGGEGATWVHLKKRHGTLPEGEEEMEEPSVVKPSWRWFFYALLVGVAYIVYPHWPSVMVAVVVILWLEARGTTK